ncbi:MAG: phosphate acyltransferase [bacterium]
MTDNALQQMLSTQLRELRRKRDPLRLGILLPDDNTIFVEALWTHLEAKWFEPILILRERFSEVIRASLSDDSQFKLSIGTGEKADVQDEAARLIREKKLDLIVLPPGQGWDITERMQRCCGDVLPPGVAGFALSRPSLLDRPLMLGDLYADTTGGSDRLAQVARLGGELLRSVGVETPRVALLAAVETVSEGIPATVVARETEESLAGSEKLHVQGPLSMDLAISVHAAEKKKVTGEVAGKADLLIGPNLTVSRGVFHAMTCLCEEPSAMVVAGGSIPFALSGKCEGPMGVVLSTLFAGILASSTTSSVY